MKTDLMAQRWNGVPVVCVGTPNQDGVDVVMEGVERHTIVLSAIREFKERNPHLNPTIRELCVMTGINSTSQMTYYLDKLAERQLIVKIPHVARGIALAK